MLERRNAIFRDTNSAAVMEEILLLHFPNNPLILDLTWGKGAFWHGGTRPVFGLDIAPRNGAKAAADARHIPIAAGVFDVAVFDPPFLHGLGSTTSTLNLGADYTRLKNQKAVRQLYYDVWPELRRVALTGAIIKCADTIESGKLNPTHADLINSLGWPADIAILESGVTRPMRPGARILHFKPAHSYFLVYKWGHA